MKHIDPRTVSSFGDEWSRFNQDELGAGEHDFLFNTCFDIFPWDSLSDAAQGFDMGCGSGRWAMLVARRVGALTCVDPSPEALTVTRRKLSHLPNVCFVNAGVSDQALPPNSQDFGYSLSVLHHVPDTAAALRDCVRMLKPGAPFLVYLYYRFDNRPIWFVLVSRISDMLRRIISALPAKSKSVVTDILALLGYLPFECLAMIAERARSKPCRWRAHTYLKTSVHTICTDLRGRFDTPLGQGSSRSGVCMPRQAAGSQNIQFSESFPFWCALGKEGAQPA